MAKFIRRIYVEPGATLPCEIHLPAGRLLGFYDGQGSLPALMVWLEVDAVTAAGAQEAPLVDLWHLWVLRSGARAPAPLKITERWDWEGVITFYRQPAVVYARKVGAVPPVRSTAEVQEAIARENETEGSMSWQRHEIADPFNPPTVDVHTRQGRQGPG